MRVIIILKASKYAKSEKELPSLVKIYPSEIDKVYNGRWIFYQDNSEAELREYDYFFRRDCRRVDQQLTDQRLETAMEEPFEPYKIPMYGLEEKAAWAERSQDRYDAIRESTQLQWAQAAESERRQSLSTESQLERRPSYYQQPPPPYSQSPATYKVEEPLEEVESVSVRGRPGASGRRCLTYQ